MARHIESGTWKPEWRAERPERGAAEKLLAEHSEPEPVKPVCGYCDGYCVHDVAGSEEDGLRFAYSQIVEHGIPMRYDLEPSQDHWTPMPWQTRQPNNLAVYVKRRDGSRAIQGPRGGEGKSTRYRVNPVGEKTKRSQAGALLSALKKQGLV